VKSLTKILKFNVTFFKTKKVDIIFIENFDNFKCACNLFYVT